MSSLRDRLEAHAVLHDKHVPHDAEQAQWAADLRDASREIGRLSARVAALGATHEDAPEQLRAALGWPGSITGPAMPWVDLLQAVARMRVRIAHLEAVHEDASGAILQAVEAERERCAQMAGGYSQAWWTRHCATNRGMDITRSAHEDFAALARAIRHGPGV